MRWKVLLMQPMAIVVILLLVVASVSARDITLSQALQMATDHAHALKQAIAEQQAAGASLGAAKRDRLPTLSATGMVNYVSYVPTLDLALPNLPPISRDIGTHDSYQADVRLSLPVFTGGRIGSSIAAASSSADYYAAMAAASEDQVVYQARVQYLAALRARRLLHAAQASQKRTSVTYDDVRSRYSAGTADTVDLLEAELASTKAESQVKAAQIALRRAEIQLLTTLGLSVTEEVTLADSLVNPPEQTDLPATLGSKPEIEAARAGVGMSNARVKLESAGYWPSLSVFGGYSYGKPNLDRFNNTWNDYFTVGAQVSWSFNIGNKTGKKKQVASYQLEAARRRLSDVQERLQENARLAAEGVQLAHTRFLSAKTEYSIAKENYRLAELSHREGALASNRLVEIEANLTAAESSLAAARVDYYIAQSGYLYAVGSDDLRKGL